MPESFSILYLSIISLTNLAHGIIGGMLSAQFGWFGKNDSLRWFVSYALIGIFCAIKAGWDWLQFLQRAW